MGTKLSRRKAALITTTAMAVVTSTVLAGCSSGTSASGGGGGSGDPAEGRIVAPMVDQTCDASPQLTQFSVDALHASVDAAAADKGTFLGEAITTDAYQRSTFSIHHDFTSNRATDAGQQARPPTSSRAPRATPSRRATSAAPSAGATSSTP